MSNASSTDTIPSFHPSSMRVGTYVPLTMDRIQDADSLRWYQTRFAWIAAAAAGPTGYWRCDVVEGGGRPFVRFPFERLLHAGGPLPWDRTDTVLTEAEQLEVQDAFLLFQIMERMHESVSHPGGLSGTLSELWSVVDMAVHAMHSNGRWGCNAYEAMQRGVVAAVFHRLTGRPQETPYVLAPMPELFPNLRETIREKVRQAVLMLVDYETGRARFTAVTEAQRRRKALQASHYGRCFPGDGWLSSE